MRICDCRSTVSGSAVVVGSRRDCSEVCTAAAAAAARGYGGDSDRIIPMPLGDEDRKRRSRDEAMGEVTLEVDVGGWGKSSEEDDGTRLCVWVPGADRAAK